MHGIVAGQRMPTQLKEPRLRGPRLQLTCLEQYNVVRTLSHCALLWTALRREKRSGTLTPRKRRIAPLLFILLSCLVVHLSTPRTQDAGIHRARYPEDFGDCDEVPSSRAARRLLATWKACGKRTWKQLNVLSRTYVL